MYMGRRSERRYIKGAGGGGGGASLVASIWSPMHIIKAIRLFAITRVHYIVQLKQENDKFYF
jgi:hypothetical protein